MFWVIVWKSIWTHEESVVHESLSEQAIILGRSEGASEPKVALLRKELSLPFVPFLGLSISATGWSCGPLKTVAWLEAE